MAGAKFTAFAKQKANKRVKQQEKKMADVDAAVAEPATPPRVEEKEEEREGIATREEVEDGGASASESKSKGGDRRCPFCSAKKASSGASCASVCWQAKRLFFVVVADRTCVYMWSWWQAAW